MKLQRKMDDLLEDFLHNMDRGPAGCALKVVYKGEVLYEGYKGYADEELGNRINPETIYRMYSCTKVITAAAVMLLLERGKLLLDDPVSKYLPEYAQMTYCWYTGNNTIGTGTTDGLTIKHLLTMTSGITYNGIHNTTQHKTQELLDAVMGGVSTREFARRLAKIPLLFAPGSHWHYGLNMEVVAAVVEVVSGMSFGEFLKKEFFEPLEMKQTAFFVEDIPKEHLAAMYEYVDGKRVPNLIEEYKFRRTYLQESGGGGLLSTVEDMSHFAEMLAGNGIWRGKRILGKRTVALMGKNHLQGEPLEDFRKTHQNGWYFMSGCGYGLGVKTVIDMAQSNTMANEGAISWAGAAGTLLWADPEKELSIVYAHQIMPNNQEGYCHPRILNVVYSCLE